VPRSYKTESSARPVSKFIERARTAWELSLRLAATYVADTGIVDDTDDKRTVSPSHKIGKIDRDGV